MLPLPKFSLQTNITTLKSEDQDLKTFVENLIYVGNIPCMDENRPWIFPCLALQAVWAQPAQITHKETPHPITLPC